METITISKFELSRLLNEMKPFVRSLSAYKAKNLMLEIFIVKEGIQLSIPKCTTNAKCETIGEGSFKFSFWLFCKVIQMSKEKHITICSDSDKISVGQTIYRKNRK